MHAEAIKSKNYKVFKELKSFNDFYLVGGTALALQIGHRVSVDFDLFTSNKLSARLFSKVKRNFRGLRIRKFRDIPGQLSVVLDDDIKIDFVEYNYPLLYNLTKFEGLKIASTKEIAVMKASTLNYRGTTKDYVDLYFLLKYGYAELREIEKDGEKKYGDEFNFRLFLEQLLYMSDVKKAEIEFLKEKVSERQISDFFTQEIKKLKL